MTLNSHTPHKKARIEIIPLIDIMFFLLASFMLVSMSMIKLQAVQTTLPSVKAPATPQQKPDFTTIGIDAKGNYYFDKDKDPIPSDKIHERLQPLYAEKQQDLKVFINADKDISYDQLMVALDEVRLLGITKVSFAVKKGHTFDPNSPARQQVPVPAAPAANP